MIKGVHFYLILVGSEYKSERIIGNEFPQAGQEILGVSVLLFT